MQRGEWRAFGCRSRQAGQSTAGPTTDHGRDCPIPSFTVSLSRSLPPLPPLSRITWITSLSHTHTFSSTRARAHTHTLSLSYIFVDFPLFPTPNPRAPLQPSVEPSLDLHFARTEPVLILSSIYCLLAGLSIRSSTTRVCSASYTYLSSPSCAAPPTHILAAHRHLAQVHALIPFQFRGPSMSRWNYRRCEALGRS